jgi:hypothetical protein
MRGPFEHHMRSLWGAALILAVVAAGAASGLAQAHTSKAALSGAVTYSTAVNEFTPGSYNQGAWSPAASNLSTFDNYFTGSQGGQTYRGYFSFDLSAGTNPCEPLSAYLTVPRGHYFGQPSTTLKLGLFDVSTLASTLAQRSNTPNAATYNDLGSGVSYGNYLLPTATGSPFTLSLNQAGLDAIGQVRANHVQWFSIGLGLVNPPAGDAFLFGWSGTHFGFTDPAITLTMTLPRICRVA